MSSGGQDSRFRNSGCPRLTLTEAVGPGPAGSGRGWQAPFEFETKYDAVLTIKFVQPGDRALDRVLDAKDNAMRKVIHRYGRRMSVTEVLGITHRNVPDLLPIFVHAEEGFGVWLIPNSHDNSTTLVAWGLNRMQDRWDFFAVGVKGSTGYLLLTGRLSRSEISDLDRGVFPVSLEEIGKPGASFGRGPQSVWDVFIGRNKAEQLQHWLASLNCSEGEDGPFYRNQEYGGGNLDDAVGHSRRNNHPPTAPTRFGESGFESGGYDGEGSSYGGPSRRVKHVGAVGHSRQTNHPFAAPRENVDHKGNKTRSCQPKDHKDSETEDEVSCW